ncbi:kinase [Arenimonas terrae]|jgi:D-glycerate 3-kinase|uniref:Kinase n=1 Tax=Arenimonas terrae TaxID=2546226 RepID=A0A5C4RVS2_9GAMM|nr:kinase [Arenimonas terrae]TNJ35356.1 kinase [Arenimonas terrae]
MPPVLHPAPGFSPGFVADRLDEALSLRGRVPVYGVAGLPGTGKSTLAAQMVRLADARGIDALALSIDDFYLGRGARRGLARRVHPLLARRGPPGTHDLPLALATLDALRRGDAVALPRFDKLADTRRPPSRWIQPARLPQLLVFEGWFLKTPPESDAALRAPINALEREHDADGRWRQWCNSALGDYAPLWQRLDWLTWLQPPGFETVPGWRWQQERRMQSQRPGHAAMSRAQVGDFLQGFERVGRQALRTLPALADRVVALDARRRPIS